MSLTKLSDDELMATKLLIAILRIYQPQFGSLHLTVMAGKVAKYEWRDTLVVK